MNKEGTLSVMEKNQEDAQTGGIFFTPVFNAFLHADWHFNRACPAQL